MDILESFTFPFVKNNEEEKLLKDFESTVKEKYDLGLVIGRFQPLHYGHVYLLKQALIICKKIIIGIGSANIHDNDNPFPVLQRKEMLEKVLRRENLNNYITNIITINDDPDDEKWFQDTIKLTGIIDVVIGNNDWVNNIFKDHGYKTIEIPLLNRDEYEGTKIRKKLREDNLLK